SEGFSASDFTNNTLLEGYDTKTLTTDHVQSAKKKLAEDANHALSEVVGTLEGRYPDKPYNIAEDILDISDAIASLESVSNLRLNKPKTAEKIEELLDQCADGVPMTLMANHVESVITGDYTLKE